MSNVVLTGANGFLGWHLRIRYFSRTQADVQALSLGERFSPEQATDLVEESDRLIHLAGVNRGTDEEVDEGNRLMAEQVAQTLRDVCTPPATVVFANSIQAGNGSVYGAAKATAADVLRKVCQERGLDFVDARLPNLFGEHGRPFYNSVVSTFCHLTARGEPVRVQQDKELELMHAQTAARALLDITRAEELGEYPTQRIRVSEIAAKLSRFAEVYGRGEIPDLSDEFHRDLFNTYRSYAFEVSSSIPLEPKADQRGWLVETMKSHGGEGQTFISTTKPGVVRGQHYHLRKIERFVVLAGKAQLGIRRMFHDDTLRLDVNGESPVAVDMPVGWVHNIRNCETEREILTQFWTSEIFDPEDTDTFYQEV